MELTDVPAGAVSRAELGAQISDRDGVEHPCWCTHHWCWGV